MPAHAAETFQHYQVLRRPDGALWELGRGAMGVTYKAFDTNLRSHVCLKVINAAHLDSETARGRFLREARAAAGLRHRNVASVYHLGNDEQSFFYAMEFVDGETVEALVKRGGPLRPPEALNIVLQVARALGAAHRQGLVHRDIKPANLMVMHEDEDEDERLVKVIDFGLARPAASTEGSAHITMGGFVGTPQYASPEQLQEQDLDTRSDIYSLGITLWFMLAGRPPFTGPLGNVFVQHLTKPPPWDLLGPLAHGPVRALLARMLAKDPVERTQTPAELRREIESCLRGLAATAAPVILPPSRAIRRPAPPTTTAATDHDTEKPDTTAPPPETVAEGTDAPVARPIPGVPTPTADTRSPAPPAEAGDAPDPSAMTAAAAAPVGEPAAPVEPEIDVGTVLAGRYRLETLTGEGSGGRVFQARDLAENERIIAVKLLHPGVVRGEEAFRAVEADVRKARAFPHPALLALDALERDGRHVFLVEEWVNGFSLVDLLRHRGQLSPREVLRLLESAASAADHARVHGLHGLQLSPRGVLTHFWSSEPAAVGTRGADGEGTRSVVALDLDRWPEFILKLDPLGLSSAAGEFVTWGGDRTLLPSGTRGTDSGRRTVSRDTQTSIRGLFTESYLPAFAALAYELLSGAPPPPANAAAPRLVAVPALREEGNALLRRCLFTGGETGLESAWEFCAALADAAGLLPMPAPPAPPMPPAPAAVPIEERSVPVEPAEDLAATVIGPTAATAPAFEKPEVEVAPAQTLFLGESLAVPAPPTSVPDLEEPAAPALPEGDTSAPTRAVLEPLPGSSVVEITEAKEIPAPAPEESSAASRGETRSPVVIVETAPAAPALLVEAEVESAATVVPTQLPGPEPVAAIGPLPLLVEEEPASPATVAPEHVSAAVAVAVADPAPAVEEPTFTSFPAGEGLLLPPEASAPHPTPAVAAPVDHSEKESEVMEVRATEPAPSPSTPLSLPPPVEAEPPPEPLIVPEIATSLAPAAPTVAREPVPTIIRPEPAVAPAPVPVRTFALPEEPYSTQRRVNPRVLAAGAGGVVLLLGVAMLAWSSSRARRPAAPVPTPPTAVATPAKPILAANRAPTVPEAPPTSTPEPPPVSRNVPPPASSAMVMPPVVNIPPAPPPADTPTEASPPVPSVPSPVENAPRPTPPPTVRYPTPEPTPAGSREPSRPVAATERSPGVSAAAAAIEARKRREREQQQQQEQQQADERRGREQARDREREREASEGRQQREREAKTRPARSEPTPRPRATPPPKKQAEKPKPPPEEERQRGPAVPFMR